MNKFIAICLVLVASTAYADIEGKVVAVSDGDTVTVLDKHQVQNKVRLKEIDAPEKKQAFGQKSKQALSDLVFGKQVYVISNSTDRYGRNLGVILVDGVQVNQRMVADGYAWAYRQYLTDPSYLKSEQNARDKKLGLWADKNPTPPWEWRKQQR